MLLDFSFSFLAYFLVKSSVFSVSLWFKIAVHYKSKTRSQHFKNHNRIKKHRHTSAAWQCHLIPKIEAIRRYWLSTKAVLSSV